MTTLHAMRAQIEKIAPAGFYVAIRVGFSFPEQELNGLPGNWIEFYTTHGLVVYDPAMKWAYGNTGAIQMSQICLPDPHQVRERAAMFGLAHGAVVSVLNPSDRGRRTYGMFFRADRDFAADDLQKLHRIIKQLHVGPADDIILTAAEIEALTMQARGLRLKQIAGELGISESAVKARFNNAKRKLGAKTQSQAASIAAARRML